MLIEYGHIYVNDLMDNTVNHERLAQGIEIARRIASAADTCWVLLDDKTSQMSDRMRQEVVDQVHTLFDDLGFVPERFHFEKAFSPEAPALLASLPTSSLRWEFFRKANKEVLFYSGDHAKIPLAQRFTDAEDSDELHYSCPVLAALWRRYKQAHCEDSVTILEQRYHTVECQVDQLLQASGFRSTGQHRFVWY